MRLGTLRKASGSVTGDQEADGLPSVVRREMTVRGTLDSTAEVRVHGVVLGDIKARKVTLCPDGYVEGNILAGEARIHGHLKGRAIARTVLIGDGATIQGKVFHHKIDVAKGMHIDARFPWRPVNYFEQFDEQLRLGE